MSIDLKPGENVFFPMPYVDGEVNLLVITNLRIVHFGDAGKQEMPARDIGFVGRMSGRPFVMAGVVLALLGLVGLGLGIYWIVSSGVLSGAKVITASDDPSAAQADAPEEEDKPPPEDTGTTKVLGFVAAPLGLVLLLVGVLLVRVNRHTVIVRGGQMVLELRAKTPMEQTMMLATLGALQSSSKAMGGGAAMAPPPKKEIKVDDKGDPVKALQDLAAQRQAGKVSQEEFEAKREVLVQRVRARK